MTINPRICTVVNTAVVAGILYKAIPLGPRSQVEQVQLTAVDKQIAVGLGSAAAAFLLVGFVSRMVLWLQNPNRIRPSSKLGWSYPFVPFSSHFRIVKIIGQHLITCLRCFHRSEEYGQRQKLACLRGQFPSEEPATRKQDCDVNSVHFTLTCYARKNHMLICLCNVSCSFYRYIFH